MKKNRWLILYIIVLFPGVLHSGWVRGKYAGAFLETGVGARAFGMGSAFVSIANDITALYWNPAGLIALNQLQVHAMHSEGFSGVVNRDFIGFGLPYQDQYAFGIGFLRLGVDGIPFTMLRDPSRRLGDVYTDENGRIIRNDPVASKLVNDNEMALLLSLACRYGKQFSYGGNIKFISKSVDDFSALGIGFDFACLYVPRDHLRIGMVIHDALSTLIVWNGGRRELILPQVKFGLSSELKRWNFIVQPSMDLHLGMENKGEAAQFHAGRIDIDLYTGFEVSFKQCIALRLGLDRGFFTAGTGLQISILGVDYGFSNHTDLGNTHRISLTLFWDKNRLKRFF